MHENQRTPGDAARDDSPAAGRRRQIMRAFFPLTEALCGARIPHYIDELGGEALGCWIYLAEGFRLRVGYQLGGEGESVTYDVAVYRLDGDTFTHHAGVGTNLTAVQVVDLVHDDGTLPAAGGKSIPSQCAPRTGGIAGYRPTKLAQVALDAASYWHKAGAEAHGLLRELVGSDMRDQGVDVAGDSFADELDAWIAEDHAERLANRT